MVILKFWPKSFIFWLNEKRLTFDKNSKSTLSNYGIFCQKYVFKKSETERIVLKTAIFRTRIDYFKKLNYQFLSPWKSLKCANVLILAYRVEQSCQYKRQEAKETLHCFYTFHAFLQRWHIQVSWHVCPFSEDFFIYNIMVSDILDMVRFRYLC